MSQLNQAMQIIRKLNESWKNNINALSNKKYEFCSAQNLIKIEMNYKFEVISLSINDGLIDPDDILTLEEMLTDTIANCTTKILKDYDNAVPSQLKQMFSMDPTGSLEKPKKEWNAKHFDYACSDDNLSVKIYGSMIIDNIKIKPEIIKLENKNELENILKNDLTDALNAVYDSWNEVNNAEINPSDLM